MIDQRPDPNTVSHEAVAFIAQQRAGEQYQEVILRDAKIQEQQQYIKVLEARLAELEQQPAPVASPRAARPRHNDLPEPEPMPQEG